MWFTSIENSKKSAGAFLIFYAACIENLKSCLAIDDHDQLIQIWNEQLVFI